MAKNDQAIATVAMMSLAAYCGWASLTAPTIPQKLGSFLGFSMAASVVSKRSKGLLKADYAGAVSELLEDTWDGLVVLGNPIAKSNILKLDSVPAPLVSALASLVAKSEDLSWLEQFKQRSRIIFGASGSGKTTWMLYEVFTALQSNKGSLKICDLDYGSCHEGSKPNNWLGLPKDRYVLTDIQDILKAVLDSSALVDSRAKQQAEGKLPDLTWQTLVLDEFPAVRSEIENKMTTKDVETFDKALKNLLCRGLKQKVNFIAGSQVPNVSETGIQINQLNQVNLLFLGDFATNQKVLGLYGLGDSGKDLATEAKELQKHGRTAVVKLDGGGSKAILIPSFNPSEVSIELPENLTAHPGDEWLSENLETIEALREENPTISLTALSKTLGIRQGRTNPQYQALQTYLTKKDTET